MPRPSTSTPYDLIPALADPSALPPANASTLQRATWLDPPGATHIAAPDDGTAGSHYQGAVEGAWGGRCRGHGHVHCTDTGFESELALEAGCAINATLRGGGHRREWLYVDDPAREAGRLLAIELQLRLDGELRAAPCPARGWFAAPRGSAFLGSEDAAGTPLAVSLRADPQHPGALSATTTHQLAAANRRWTPLALRFAVRVHSSLDHAMRWRVSARMTVAPLERAVQVQLAAAPQPRHSEASELTRRST